MKWSEKWEGGKLHKRTYKWEESFMKGPGSGGGQASEVGWKLGGSSYMRGLESSGADFQHWLQGLVTNYFYPLTYSSKNQQAPVH